ncbi:glucokinase [Oleiagrimonas sp. C23AA]|uniref:glucokinase n=1 Tax=Oleiagrimonas sp. C23AA TaxID=2719047 RepID=UPI001423936E|nr:glucokinase [Oleiagrimonas sp. C23AA]NII10169.1 glucokinase [Oleiagrimonas sp. C23AA]
MVSTLIDPSYRRESGAAMPFLAADIGGTHARVALVRHPLAAEPGRDLQMLAYRTYRCADFPSLASLLRTFLDNQAHIPVRHGVLACAGQLSGDEVLNDNVPWPMQLTEVRQALGLADLAMLNDFEALGYAMDTCATRQARLVCGPDVQGDGPVLVLGPGTGLGAALKLPASAGGHVMATEVGQMDFASYSIREREIVAQLMPQGGYLPYECIVSGPGLLNLYRALCALRGQTPGMDRPEAVSAAALDGGDSHAVEAVQVFCAALGSLAGSLAMAFMSVGGVYLAGGFLSAMFEQLRHSAFEERFLHGRSIRAFLSQIPVRVLEHGSGGVLGAARWYLTRMAPAGTGSPLIASDGT